MSAVRLDDLLVMSSLKAKLCYDSRPVCSMQFPYKYIPMLSCYTRWDWAENEDKQYGASQSNLNGVV